MGGLCLIRIKDGCPPGLVRRGGQKRMGYICPQPEGKMEIPPGPILS